MPRGIARIIAAQVKIPPLRTSHWTRPVVHFPSNNMAFLYRGVARDRLQHQKLAIEKHQKPQVLYFFLWRSLVKSTPKVKKFSQSSEGTNGCSGLT